MIQLIMTLMLSFTNAYADSETLAIKSMAGCYKVDYKAEETEKTKPDYPISSAPFHDWGVEWIELDYDTEDEVHLQHILLTPHGPLKHWRQEWLRNPASMMSFKGDNTWETSAIVKPEGTLWLQRVLQVDDSPRYECAAPWNITENSSTWNCKAWSPLPRREFTKRSDYNVLDRGNFVVLNSKGWIHHQLNDKVLTSKTSTEIIAKEKGANTYEKIDDSQCLAAQTWWKDNKKVWHDIQSMWKHVVGHHPNLKLKKTVDEKTLWMHLFELADVYAKKAEYDSKVLQKEAHDVIHKFFENHE